MFNFNIWILFLTLATNLFAVDPDTTIVIDSTSCNVRDSVHAPTGQSFVRCNNAVVKDTFPDVQIHEDVFIQAFITELPIEALDISILVRLTGLDIIPSYFLFLTPA